MLDTWHVGDDGNSLTLMCEQVYELQQEFGGASFATASRLFVREGDLFKVQHYPFLTGHAVTVPDLNSPCRDSPHSVVRSESSPPHRPVDRRYLPHCCCAVSSCFRAFLDRV